MIFQVVNGRLRRAGEFQITLDVIPESGIKSGSLTLNVAVEKAGEFLLGACIDQSGKVVADPRVKAEPVAPAK